MLLCQWCCQFVQQLPERVCDLTVHPDGMQLAVAHENRLSMYHASLDALLAWKDVPMQGGRVVCYAQNPYSAARAEGRV